MDARSARRFVLCRQYSGIPGFGDRVAPRTRRLFWLIGESWASRHPQDEPSCRSGLDEKEPPGKVRPTLRFQTQPTDETPASIAIRSQFGIVFRSSARGSESYLVCVLPIQCQRGNARLATCFFVPIGGVMCSGSTAIRRPRPLYRFGAPSTGIGVVTFRATSLKEEFTRAGTTWRRKEGEAHAVCKPGGAPIGHNSGGPK